MKRTRTFKMAAVGLIAAVAASVSLAGPAKAASDQEIILSNLPAALTELVDGFQEALDVYLATESVEDTAEALGDALVAVGGAIVAGTDQFGQLGLGFLLLNAALQANIEGLAQAIDDPSTAGSLVNPDDLMTLANNLGPAYDALVHGQGNFGGLASAAAEALEGNLVDNSGFLPGLGQPAALGDAFNGLAAGLSELASNTNFEPTAGLGLIVALLGAGAAGGYVQTIEDAVAPAASGPLAPILAPIVRLLRGL